MKFSILPLLLLVSNFSLQAIGYYQPGDTLYVWAVSGLTLRKEASLKSAKLATIPYGTLVVAQNYPYDDKVEVEAVPAHSSDGQKSPAVMLEGSFVKVIFQGDTGYVFDGYLSRLPVLKPVKASNDWPDFEDFDVWAKRNFRLAAEQKSGVAEYGSYHTAKQVYANGFSRDNWVEKSGQSRFILPDVSLEEAFLLFNYLHQYEWEIRHQSNEPNATQWIHTQAGKYEWRFGNINCEYKILYLPEEKMAVITSVCSC
ncbi:MAG: SH3 domain-containing protein [Haliscomenobacteraceae bacterium CHB4]|nr:hypothetical protein [Saprospiraceae bacterium]MCE7926122.1 SH3 domain-containing protein [Haliscomenobacteraceae bacterium CHB4]